MGVWGGNPGTAVITYASCLISSMLHRVTFLVYVVLCRVASRRVAPRRVVLHCTVSGREHWYEEADRACASSAEDRWFRSLRLTNFAQGHE